MHSFGRAAAASKRLPAQQQVRIYSTPDASVTPAFGQAPVCPRLASMSVGAGVINVALSIILVQRVGVAGVTLGTLIATSLVTLIFVMPYVLRVIGLGIGKALKDAFLPVLLPAIPMTIVLVILQQVIQTPSWLRSFWWAIQGYWCTRCSILAWGRASSSGRPLAAWCSGRFASRGRVSSARDWRWHSIAGSTRSVARDIRIVLYQVHCRCKLHRGQCLDQWPVNRPSGDNPDSPH